MREPTSDTDCLLSHDGVSLRKRLERADDDLPAIVYEIESARAEAVAVRIVEPIPEGLAPENIGFRGQRVSEVWQVTGPKLVFEAELEADEVRKTACAARGDNADAIEALLASPDSFDVEPRAPSEAPEPHVSLRPNGGLPVSADGRGRDDDGDGDGATPGEGQSRSGDVAGPQSASTVSAERARDAPMDPEPVVEQFVRELRAEQVSEESIEYLRQEIGTPSSPRRSVEARLKQLQTDLSDVRAYTNALEAFLDENGSAEEVIDHFEERLDAVDESVESLDGRVESVDGRVDETAADVSNLQGAVDSLEEDVEATASELAALRESVDSLEATLGQVEGQLPEYDVGERIAELEAQVDEVAGFTENLKAAFE